MAGSDVGGHVLYQELSLGCPAWSRLWLAIGCGLHCVGTFLDCTTAREGTEESLMDPEGQGEQGGQGGRPMSKSQGDGICASLQRSSDGVVSPSAGLHMAGRPVDLSDPGLLHDDSFRLL